MRNSIAPLSAGVWFDRLEKVAAGELGSVERGLRHTCHLLQLSPEPFRPHVNWEIDEAEFEVLLDAQDFGAAVQMIVAKPAALSYSDNDRSRVAALIRDEQSGHFSVGHGETDAEATLNAWLQGLLALRRRATRSEEATSTGYIMP